MASYLPPNETLPIFDTTVFDQEVALDYKTALTQFLTYPVAQGQETLQAITVQGQADFENQVNFNYLNSPPHCSIPPTGANDLCNKAYVDSQAPLTSFQLFCNYSQTFTTPTPTTYKLLSDAEVYTPTTLPWTISAIGTQYITGFFNLITTLNIGSVIPPGNWTLNCYANVNAISDQSHVGLSYTIVGVSSLGVESVLYTSSSSTLITVVSPSIGIYPMTITVPSTSITAYVDIGIKLYITSNVGATRTGNIYFQNTSSYTSLLTSFSVLAPATIVSSNNVWTGTNSFNNQLDMGASGSNTLTFNGTSGNINSSSGTMNIKTNNVNAMTINSSQIVSFNNAPSMSGASISNGTIPLLSVVGTACDISTSQTVGGTKTFSTPPVMSGASITSGTIPILSVVGTACDLTTSQTIGGTKTFSNAPTMSGTGITGGIPITSVVGTAMDLTTDQNVSGNKTYFGRIILQGSTQLNIGTILQTAGQPSSRILQQTSFTVFTNNYTSGVMNFTTHDGSNNPSVPFSISSALTALNAINNTAPTASPGNNTTTIATTAFVTNAVSGSVGTASNVNVVNQTATAGSFNVGILQGVSGALPVGASSGLTYNNTLGTLTCNNFNGTAYTALACSGNSATASSCSGNSVTATTATKVSLTTDNTSGSYLIPFSKALTTSETLYADNSTTSLTYNPFNSNLACSTFTGNVFGNASTATNAVNQTNGVPIPAMYFFYDGIFGGGSSESGTHTFTALPDTNYMVFTSFYYGYSGSGGTYNATASSSAVNTVIITSITTTSFGWTFARGSGNNLAVYLVHQLIRSPSLNFPKSY